MHCCYIAALHHTAANADSVPWRLLSHTHALSLIRFSLTFPPLKVSKPSTVHCHRVIVIINELTHVATSAPTACFSCALRWGDIRGALHVLMTTAHSSTPLSRALGVVCGRIWNIGVLQLGLFSLGDLL